MLLLDGRFEGWALGRFGGSAVEDWSGGSPGEGRERVKPLTKVV